MSEDDKKDDGIAIPTVWGVATALFVAILLQAALPFVVLVAVCVAVFGGFVLSSRALRRLFGRSVKPRRAAARVGFPARGKLRPSAAMARAAMQHDADADDDLKEIVGVDPRLEESLHALGITRHSQIAAWTPEEAARMDAELDSSPGRVARQDWIGQAQRLVLGRRQDDDGDTSGTARQG